MRVCSVFGRLHRGGKYVLINQYTLKTEVYIDCRLYGKHDFGRVLVTVGIVLRSLPYALFTLYYTSFFHTEFAKLLLC